MIIEKKKPEEGGINPYDWPENYYMETDPASRKEILDEQMRKDAKADLGKRQELFERRYTMNRKKEYKDCFMEACLDLLYLASNLNKAFSSRANKRMAAKAIRQLCLDQEAEYGTEILYEELCHLIRCYIMISRDDPAYRSVILKVVKMDDKQCREKIKRDLKIFAETIPESLGMEGEFGLLKRAVLDTQKDFL